MKYMLSVFSMLMLCSAMSAQQFPDRHNTEITDSWTSCTVSENPNKVREDGHWIMYDFGNEYTLQGTTLWNINAYQHTDKGTQELVIDYSIDGEDWIELGYHTMAEGPASSFYLGEEGPSFGGANARYVIITSISNYGHATCHGLSEVRFQATIASTTTNTEDIIADNSITISPNPFVNQTSVTLTDIESGTYSYTVSDVTGKLVLEGSVEVTSDNVTLPLNMATHTSGSYIFRLQYGALTLSKKLQLIR